VSVKQVEALFPEALRSLLLFEQQGDYVIIKPRQFLGTENFSDIARIVQGNKGDYVSAGKESHFRIPIAPAPTETPPKPVPHDERYDSHPPTDLHFKVTKLTVGIGTTIQQGEKEWTKQSYGLEVEVNSDAKDIVEKAKAEAEQLVRSWLAEPMLPSAEIPQIDIGELNACEWTTYKKPAEKAKAGQAGWIKNPVEFTSWANPPNVLLELVKAMKRSPDEKLVLGDMEYSFSGKGDMKNHFISRKPVKTETAK